MAVAKKSKEKRNAEVERIREYSGKYTHVAVIKNPDIPNVVLKKMREDFSNGAKILFVRKKMARAMYNMPDLPKESFFLMFGDRETVEAARTYRYRDFLEAGDVCPVRGVVERQVVRNKEMAGLLPVSMRDGQLQLVEDYVVCEAGELVDENKAKILRFFGQRLRRRCLDVLSVTATAGLLENKRD